MTDKPCPLCGNGPYTWIDYMGANLRRCSDEECLMGHLYTQIAEDAWNSLPRRGDPWFGVAQKDALALEGLALEAIKAFGCHPRELALVTQTSPDGRKTTWRIEKI